MNAYDIVSSHPTSQKISHGITYTWDGDVCTVIGTASTANFYNLAGGTNVIPFGVKPGDKLSIRVSGTNGTKVYIRVIGYVNGEANELITTNVSNVCTVPENVTGLIIRIYVATGKTANCTIECHVYAHALVDEITQTVGQISANLQTVGSNVTQNTADITDLKNKYEHGNIFPKLEITETIKNGVTYSASDGWYMFNGIASEAFVMTLTGFTLESGKTYLFYTGGFNGNVYLRITDTNGNFVYQISRSQKITIPNGVTIANIRFYVATNKNADNIKICPRIYLAETNPVNLPKPALTIVDDDGAIGFYNDALPVIISKNVPISTAVIPTYASGSSASYMRWNQVEECYLSGAEILCHTYDHSNSEQQEVKPIDQIQREFQMAQNIFRNKGYSGNILVYAGGTGNIHKVYDAGCNVFKYGVNSGVELDNYYGNIDPHNIYRNTVNFDDLDTLKSAIDEALVNGTWMIWMMHTSAGIWSSSNVSVMEAAIDYAKSVGLDIITIEAGCRRFIEDAL